MRHGPDALKALDNAPLLEAMMGMVEAIPARGGMVRLPVRTLDDVVQEGRELGKFGAVVAQPHIVGNLSDIRRELIASGIIAPDPDAPPVPNDEGDRA